MQRSEKLKKEQFSRRAFLISGLQASAFAALTARLYYLQNVKVEEFTTRAEGNRIRLIPSVPERGKILDKNGEVLAEGRGEYQLLFEPPKDISNNQIKDVGNRLSDILALELEDRTDFVDLLLKSKNGKKTTAYKGLTWDQLAQIEVSKEYLVGADIHHAMIRQYPQAELVSHLIGYVGKVDEKSIAEDPSLKAFAYDPFFRLGKSGVEKSMEETLHGNIGFSQVEVDALGRHIRDLKHVPGTNGADVKLTIDLKLQRFVSKLMQNKGGLKEEGNSTVVMDVRNGNILAMVSLPSYDNNLFIEGISHKNWNNLLNNIDKPLINRSISSLYPPGSTFKTMTALAALEAGVVDETSRVFCPGHYELGGRRFHCWNRGGHGYVNMKKALAVSCNVYFYETSLKVGIKRIAAMAEKYGLGQATDIALPGELEGLIATPDWKQENKNKPWYKGETLNAAIGQGYNLVTPLQLAVQVARLATNKEVMPRIVDDGSSPFFNPLRSTSVHSLSIVRNGMHAVVNDPMGAVYKYRIEDRNFEFAGKTGTAQVINQSFKGISEEVSKRNHSLFIGYAPYDKPRYAIATVVEHGGYGSMIAAPPAAEIFKKLQEWERNA